MFCWHELNRFDSNLETMQKLEPSSTEINMKTISAFGEIFDAHPVEHLTWLIECSNYSGMSKTLFFLVILQSLNIKKRG